MKTKEDFKPEQETPADTELRTVWLSEIKPVLDAEMDFLRQYGAKAGYDEATVNRIAEYHRKMEKLVWESGEDHVQKFATVMGLYVHFKEEFFLSRVQEVGNQGSVDHGLPAA